MSTHLPTSPWAVFAVFAVGIIGIARATRLITYDDYPPVIAIRSWWDKITDDGAWSKLVHCGFCASPYITIICGLWGWLSHFNAVWFIVWGWLAVSYVASVIVAYDQRD